MVGCNVENAAYGVVLCAECGLVSSLHATGGGRLVALSCVDGAGEPLMPCGRCRQLLWEHGGPECLVDCRDGAAADGASCCRTRSTADRTSAGVTRSRCCRPRLREWQGRGTVFVHPDMRRRSAGLDGLLGAFDRLRRRVRRADEERGILEEGPTWPTWPTAVAWGRARTPRVVVVDADGGLCLGR